MYIYFFKNSIHSQSQLFQDAFNEKTLKLVLRPHFVDEMRFLKQGSCPSVSMKLKSKAYPCVKYSLRLFVANSCLFNLMKKKNNPNNVLLLPMY